MNGRQPTWDFVRFVDTLTRGRLVIGLCCLSAGVVAGLMAWFVLPKVYQAKVVFMVKESQIEAERTALREADVKLYEAIIKNQTVLKNLAEAFDLSPEKYRMRRLESMVEVEALKNAPLLELTVEFENDPVMARDLALYLANQAQVKNASLEQQELLEGRELLEEEERDALSALQKSEQDLLESKREYNLEARQAEIDVLLERISGLKARRHEIEKQLAIHRVDPVFQDYWAKRREVEEQRKEAQLSLRDHEIEILQHKKAEADIDLFRLDVEVASKEAELAALEQLIAAAPVIKSSTRALLTDPEYYLAVNQALPAGSPPELRMVNEYENPIRESLIGKEASVRSDLAAVRQKRDQLAGDLEEVVSELDAKYLEMLDHQERQDALQIELQLKQGEFSRLFDTSPSTYEAEKEVIETELARLEREYHEKYLALITGQIAIGKKGFDHEVKRDTYRRVVQKLDEIDLTVLTKARNLVVVDPPVTPDRKVKPKRTLIVIVALFAAFALSSTYLLIREYLREARRTQAALA